VHLGIKRLGRIGRIGHRISGDRRARLRGIGLEYVHVAVDDATRLAYVEVLPDEQGVTVTTFLWRALASYRRLEIRVRRIPPTTGRAIGRTSVTHVHLKPGGGSDWDPVMRKRLAAARKRPGWIGGQLLRPAAKEDRWVIVGTWKTRADWVGFLPCRPALSF
jgi:hypothetical protein